MFFKNCAHDTITCFPDSPSRVGRTIFSITCFCAHDTCTCIPFYTFIFPLSLVAVAEFCTNNDHANTECTLITCSATFHKGCLDHVCTCIPPGQCVSSSVLFSVVPKSRTNDYVALAPQSKSDKTIIIDY